MKITKSLLFFVFLTSLVLLTSCSQLSGLFGPQAQACTVHKDLNRDNVCDTCGKAIPVNCTNHTDTDHDGKCDTNGCTVELAVFHTDANHDGICDAENCTFAIEVVHTDTNNDGKCDGCGKVLEKEPCTVCTDSNEDGKCDVCGGEVKPPEKEPCTECTDTDKDGKCDVCGEAVQIPEDTSIKLIENGKIKFSLVVANGLSGAATKSVNTITKKLSSLGYTLEKLEDSSDVSSKYDIEVLIGQITGRGDAYNVDPHYLGMKGYAVKELDGKILVIGGSDEGLDKAISYFIETVLGITDDTKKLTSASFDKEKEHEFIQDDYDVTSVTVGGEDIRSHVIAYDSSNSENIKLARSIQETLYKYSGYWLNIIKASELSNEGYIMIKTAEKSGDLGFYVKVIGTNLEITSEFSNKTLSTGETYIKQKLITLSGDVALDDKEYNVRDIYYSEFGAVGDGVTDDYKAITDAHKYANEYGHDVYADRNATYYIGNGHTKSAVIKTNTYWGNAKFTIDDSKIDASNAAERSMNIFNIAPSTTGGAKYTAADGNLPITEIYKNQTNIGFAPGFTALIKFTHASHKNYIRYGGNADDGGYQLECVLVDKDGNILEGTELMWDYSELSKIEISNVDEKPITVSGGFFTTIYNQAPSEYTSYARGIWVYRSNTTVKDVRHRITGEGDHGAPSGGFTIASYANNVVFDNIEYDNPKSFYTMGSGGSTVVMGSYEIQANYCTNITWQNCTQVDFWQDDTKTYAKAGGLMGTNHCKNMNFLNMTVSSFDSHGGAQNIKIIGGQIEHINCIGAGYLYVEGTRIHALHQSCAIILRSDYGSLWMGDATFKDVTLVTGTKESVALFRAGWVNHDYGYKSQMPTNVYVENLKIESEIGLNTVNLVMDAAASKAYLLYWDETVEQEYKDPKTGEITVGPNKNVYKITENWYIKDTQGYDYQKPYQFTTNIICEDE